MQIEGLGDITKQCEIVLEAKQQELLEAQDRIGVLKSEIAALEKLTKVAASIGNITVSARAARTPRPVVARGEGRGAALVAILRDTDKSLDLGTLARKLGLEDNSANRTKVSAALTPLVVGPQSPVVRVATGIYAARTVGAVEMPDEEVAEASA